MLHNYELQPMAVQSSLQNEPNSACVVRIQHDFPAQYKTNPRPSRHRTHGLTAVVWEDGVFPFSLFASKYKQNNHIIEYHN